MNEAAQSDVRNAEAARLVALRDNDGEALGPLLHDALTYLHSGGEVDTRASYLSAIRTGALRYGAGLQINEQSLEPEGEDLRVRAHMTGEVRFNGADRRLNSETLSTWRRADGAWRLVRFEAHPTGR